MLGKLTATVLIVEDLKKCRAFYQDMLGLKSQFDDDVSSAYQIEGHDFVLLETAAAVEMMGEGAVSPEKANGHRTLLCIGVEDVDVTYNTLTAKGVAFIKPPKSQHWGRRTAYFADPEGNLWELWHTIPEGQG